MDGTSKDEDGLTTACGEQIGPGRAEGPRPPVCSELRATSIWRRVFPVLLFSEHIIYRDGLVITLSLLGHAPPRRTSSKSESSE